MKRALAHWPLRVHLRDPIDNMAIHRMWQRIEERGQVRPIGLRTALYGVAATAALLVVLSLGALRWTAVATRELLTESGAPFVQLLAPPHHALSQRFADGSLIDAEPGTLVQGLASSAQEFSVLLERGTIAVSVVPGGPRRWVIEAKVARVEVVGTQFSVTRRDNDEVTIVVQQGVVLVRSAALPQGIERLIAGRSLRLPPPTPSDQPTKTPAASSAEAALATNAGQEERKPHIAEPATSTARTAPSASSLPLRPSASEMMRLADKARLTGDTARAERLLDRLVREFPGDPQAGIAAYTLAVLRIQRGKTQAAVDALRLALALRPPSSVQQDCYLRLVEAELAIGQRERAFETAREYQGKFPNGRYRRAIAALFGAAGAPPLP